MAETEGEERCREMNGSGVKLLCRIQAFFPSATQQASQPAPYGPPFHSIHRSLPRGSHYALQYPEMHNGGAHSRVRAVPCSKFYFYQPPSCALQSGISRTLLEMTQTGKSLAITISLSFPPLERISSPSPPPSPHGTPISIFALSSLTTLRELFYDSNRSISSSSRPCSSSARE